MSKPTTGRDSAGLFASRHGDTGTPEHRTWCGIIQRCTNPRSSAWPRYGGRGITICDRWRHSYEAFLADVGRRPSPRHSIDRYPNPEGHYEPGNVRWATTAQQARNKRTSLVIEYRGERKTLADWCDELGLNRNVVTTRLRAGDSPAAAFTAPPHRGQRPNKKGTRLLTARGVTLSIVEWSRRTGLSASAISDRLSRGWSVEDAVRPDAPALLTPRGEQRAAAKLTEQAVREIRARYAAGGISQATLAREYGVSARVVQLAIARATWKHVA